MNIEKKDIAYVILIILTVAISVVIFFYPSLIDYPYSYNNLVEKQEEIEDKNYTLNQNEGTILSKIDELERTEEDRKRVHAEAVDLKRNIREEDFKLDMPAFLISMEQQANKDNVKLIIDYNSITTSGTTSGTEVDSGQTDSDPRDEERQDDEEYEERPDPRDEMMDGRGQPQELDVTTIPIKIEGSYHNIRSYLKYLDEIGMIEPSSIQLNSEEKLVKGEVVLEIFHGEVIQ